MTTNISIHRWVPKKLWGRIALAGLVIIVAAVSTLSNRAPCSGGDLEQAIEAMTRLSLRKGTLAFLDDAPDSANPRWRTGLMLASATPSEPADLYSIEVKLRQDGSALAVREPVNLSATPQAEERNLVVHAPLAAVSAVALGQTRAVTLLDFRGSAVAADAPWSRTTLALSRVSNLLETGRLEGVGKTTFRFGRPPRSLAFGFVRRHSQVSMLRLDWQDARGAASTAQIDPDRVDATTPSTLCAAVDERLPKSPILWTVDTVRSLSFVGPGPIEWAEGRFFAAKDALRRFGWRHGLVSEEEEAPLPSKRPASTHKALVVPPGLVVGAVDENAVWPPAPLKPPVFSRPGEKEGQWRPGSPEFRARVLEGDDVIYRTYVRTDPERPYAKVELFAMDMRRLSLHAVAGLEDPEPTTGSQGTGILPRDPDFLPRIVAAWNGAFKALHGAYGMVADRDVLLPPKDDAATVASFEDGRAVMGSWPTGGQIPSALVSLRQNMDPLVENGVINPRRRYLWGFTLGEDLSEMNTIRSGLCMTKGGHLVYAWGEDLTATTLAAGMNAAGCVYGMHLDMNPFHTSFIHYRFDPLKPGEKPVFDALLDIPAMRYSVHRYVFASPKDFFYVALKKQGPGEKWKPTGLAQPAPADIPAVYALEEQGCWLVATDLSRARLFLSSGEVPAHLLPAPLKLPKADATALLVTARLRARNSALGQIAGAAHLAPMVEGAPTLALGDSDTLHLGPWSSSQLRASTSDALQSTSPAPNENVVAVGLLKGRYLVIAQGPAVVLDKILLEQGVEAHVDFLPPQDQPNLLVRGETGLMDAKRQPVAQLDMTSAILYVVAQPRPLGMQPLSSFVTSGNQAPR